MRQDLDCYLSILGRLLALIDLLRRIGIPYDDTPSEGREYDHMDIGQREAASGSTTNLLFVRDISQTIVDE